jgi:ligand-binding sensor domain-containing protein
MFISALALSSDQTLSIGAGLGLHQLDGDEGENAQITLFRDSFPSGTVTALTFDENTQTLWMGTSSGIYSWMPDLEAHPHHVFTPPNLSSFYITSIALDPIDGTVWASLAHHGVVHFGIDGQLLHHLSASQAILTSDYVRDLTFDSDGYLLVATSLGVARMKVH